MRGERLLLLFRWLRDYSARGARTGWLAVLLLTLAAGCGDDQTGIPQPFPLPLADNMRASGAVPEMEQEIDLIGLPGAVAGEGEVTIRHDQVETKTRSTAAGSFIATIKAQVGTVLQITIEDSPAAEYTVQSFTVSSPTPPGPISGVPPISGPTGGQITITGQASPLQPVIAVNLVNGSVGLAEPAADGRFSAQLTAQSGDDLRVYEDTSPLSVYWELSVP